MRKSILLTCLFFAFNLFILNIDQASAKTFWGDMKDGLSTKDDLKNHYNFHRRLGALMRYAPGEYQLIGVAGMTTASFLTKELFWDLICRRGSFDMRDAAANLKGLKDGMSGINELEENEFRSALQEINSLTRQLIVDTQHETLIQKSTIAELKAQNEQLRKLLELQKFQPVSYKNPTEQEQAEKTSPAVNITPTPVK